MHEVGDQSVERERQINSPLIIGVGAPPTALGSIERFFGKLTLGADQAVVLALQHHEALDEPRLRRIVQNSSGGKVADIRERRTVQNSSRGKGPDASDGQTIEGGTISLCQPAIIPSIRGGRFAVREA